MAEPVRAPCPISHVEWCCRDLDAACRFFESLFAWRFRRFSRHYALYAPPSGVRVGLMERDAAAASGPGVFVTVADIDAVLAQAQALGGRLDESAQTIPGYGRWAHFLDLDGNRIGLFEPLRGTG